VILVGATGDRKERGRMTFKITSTERPPAQEGAAYGTGKESSLELNRNWMAYIVK
jgi:hypothetical protein